MRGHTRTHQFRLRVGDYVWFGNARLYGFEALRREPVVLVQLSGRRITATVSAAIGLLQVDLAFEKTYCSLVLCRPPVEVLAQSCT